MQFTKKYYCVKYISEDSEILIQTKVTDKTRGTDTNARC
jgi:hypothetical protein